MESEAWGFEWGAGAPDSRVADAQKSCLAHNFTVLDVRDALRREIIRRRRRMINGARKILGLRRGGGRVRAHKQFGEIVIGTRARRRWRFTTFAQWKWRSQELRTWSALFAESHRTGICAIQVVRIGHNTVRVADGRQKQVAGRNSGTLRPACNFMWCRHFDFIKAFVHSLLDI